MMALKKSGRAASDLAVRAIRRAETRVSIPRVRLASLRLRALALLFTATACVPACSKAGGASAGDGGLVLPGECSDPVSYVKEKQEKRGVPADAIASVEARTLFDLDGDGKDDVAVETRPRYGTQTSTIFVMRGTCGHAVGEIEQRKDPFGGYDGLVSNGEKKSGLEAIDVSRSELGTCTQTFTTYAFDGTRYAKTATKTRAIENCRH